MSASMVGAGTHPSFASGDLARVRGYPEDSPIRITRLHAKDLAFHPEHECLTVVLTKFIGSWRYRMFHNHTSLYIENRLSRHINVVTVLVPIVYDVE